jgi:hypothetical protein
VAFEVERRDEHIRVAGLCSDVSGDSFAGFDVADCERDLGSCGSERAGSLDAEAGGGARDDGAFACEVDACNHIVGGGVVREGSNYKGSIIGSHDTPLHALDNCTPSGQDGIPESSRIV